MNERVFRFANLCVARRAVKQSAGRKSGSNNGLMGVPETPVRGKGGLLFLAHVKRLAMDDSHACQVAEKGELDSTLNRCLLRVFRCVRHISHSIFTRDDFPVEKLLRS